MSADKPESRAERPEALTAPPLTRTQRLFTRLRVGLALLAAAALVYLVDRGPVWPGMLVAAFGECWQLWAAAHLHKNVSMVKSGPYALLRNPMYFGRFFVGLGFILLTWRWYLVAGYAVIFALYAQARVLGEEARLRGLFGDEYAEFCRGVNRWLPWPRTRFSDARWSWEAVRRNHQLRVSLGVALTLVVLWARVHYPAAFGLGR